MSKTTIGNDIIEVSRFREKPIDNNKKFYCSIFTENELEYCLKYSDPYIHLAGIFAAKEAIIKSINKKISIKQIEIGWMYNGKPILKDQKMENIDISISHTKSIAIAIAINQEN